MRKIGQSRKGKSPWMKGKHHTEDTRRKWSKIRKGKKLPQEQREKMRNAHLGLKHSGLFRKGRSPWNKGKAGLQKGRRGEASNLWKGGKSFEPYSVDWTKTLRKSIRQRDGYICQICGFEPSIYVHHIDYDKKNSNPDNLITLCQKCHSRTNIKREYWKKFFLEKNKNENCMRSI